MIAVGCDHGGFELKQKILAHLQARGLAYQDFGCGSTASVDYPVYGKAVARAVASGQCEKGIVICSTGIGISIAANKVPGIRCALCGDCFSARATRQHTTPTFWRWARWLQAPAWRWRLWTFSWIPHFLAKNGTAAGSASWRNPMLEFCASILAADFARLDRDIAAAEAAGINAFPH